MRFRIGGEAPVASASASPRPPQNLPREKHRRHRRPRNCVSSVWPLPRSTQRWPIRVQAPQPRPFLQLRDLTHCETACSRCTHAYSSRALHLRSSDGNLIPARHSRVTSCFIRGIPMLKKTVLTTGLAAALIAPPFSVAAETREVVQLRAQVKAMQDKYDSRLQALEKRLQESEARVEAANAAATATPCPTGSRAGARIPAGCP